ncbi:inosine-5'-monophosphate dehydrogenase [bacterium BMS3Abin05]|nr:inosine-5'-monophosphate dehydrogenase [bacterium BMS3Abin05]GBE27580.1 inosine-5'-monophosphate dehydrogenase [bacterium BMS3Bbin03]HDZ12005.1 CBS domain-containing protein [Bacteroidota bacterium]
MLTIKDLLAQKSKKLITIQPDASIFDAAQVLVANSIGALPVVENEKLVGIISERDILRLCVRRLDYMKEASVKEIMTTELIIGLPSDDIEYVEGIITTNKIRHIPVIENDKLIGIVSIGDVVKSQLQEAHYENHYLKDYIMGKYPA